MMTYILRWSKLLHYVTKTCPLRVAQFCSFFCFLPAMMPLQLLPLLLVGSVASQPKPGGRKRQRGNPHGNGEVASRPSPLEAASHEPASSSPSVPSLTFSNPVQVQEPELLGANTEESEYEDIELECFFDEACKFKLTNFLPSTNFPRQGCEPSHRFCQCVLE